MKELEEKASRNGSCPSMGLDPSVPWTEKELVSEEWGCYLILLNHKEAH